ncbi:hypothetical protein CBF23_000790 [Marinomonas agarivorans]|nr:hypothetical protein CBF23_000790 [Marinomonas agarivorans]
MKLLIWTLIEINTVLFITIGVASYLLYKQKKRKQLTEDTPEATNTDSSSSSEQTEGTDLDRFIVKQLNHATRTLLEAKHQNDEKRVTLTKLWGTLLNAERRILKEEQTEDVLKEFLSPILKAIFESQNSEETLSDLEKKLEQVIAQTNESSATLDVKEELERVQDSLRKTLVDEIEHLEKATAKLQLKHQEKSKLDANLASAYKKHEKLKQELQALESEQMDDDFFNDTLFSPSASIAAKRAQHSATKQIKELTKLYERQKNVIELLKGKVDLSKANDIADINEAGEIGVDRLERLVQESDTLIAQLEGELANAEQENMELKTNIENKSEELTQITKQLAANKKSAIGSLKEHTQTNQMVVANLKNDLQGSHATPEIMAFVEQQANEINTIERLLQESETCVTLLEQELKTAKQNNDQLLETIKGAEQQAQPSSPDNQERFEKEQQRKETLLLEHTQIKEQLLSSVANDNEAQLRSDYNKKNLELDRLQLALIDLEKKHIKLLSTKNEGGQKAAD